MSKKIKLFLIGMHRSGGFLQGLRTSAAPEKPQGVEFEAEHVDTLEWAMHRCEKAPDLDLICIADQHDDIGFGELATGFEKLAPVLAAHPNHPAVYLLDLRMSRLAEPFLAAGVAVMGDPKEFWQFITERHALKNKAAVPAAT